VNQDWLDKPSFDPHYFVKLNAGKRNIQTSPSESILWIRAGQEAAAL
jgi:hypothetical protein